MSYVSIDHLRASACIPAPATPDFTAAAEESRPGCPAPLCAERGLLALLYKCVERVVVGGLCPLLRSRNNDGTAVQQVGEEREGE